MQLQAQSQTIHPQHTEGATRTAESYLSEELQCAPSASPQGLGLACTLTCKVASVMMFISQTSDPQLRGWLRAGYLQHAITYTVSLVDKADHARAGEADSCKLVTDLLFSS